MWGGGGGGGGGGHAPSERVTRNLIKINIFNQSCTPSTTMSQQT